MILWVVVPLWGISQYRDLITHHPSNFQDSHADCGVVLTGGAGRIREGMALMSRGKIQKLIISGVHQHTTMADMIPEILYYPEIDLEKIILERRSNSTAGNAQQSMILVDALKCKSMLLITSDYHMHRAYKTFDHIFPPTVQIMPYVVASDRTYGMKLWSTAFEEFFKYIFYMVFVF